MHSPTAATTSFATTRTTVPVATLAAPPSTLDPTEAPIMAGRIKAGHNTNNNNTTSRQCNVGQDDHKDIAEAMEGNVVGGGEGGGGGGDDDAGSLMITEIVFTPDAVRTSMYQQHQPPRHRGATATTAAAGSSTANGSVDGGSGDDANEIDDLDDISATVVEGEDELGHLAAFAAAALTTNGNGPRASGGSSSGNSSSLRRARVLGERTLSTCRRLSAEGLTPSSHLRRTSYAVRAIHRGTAQWKAQLRPFVSDLAFRSIRPHRLQHQQQQQQHQSPEICFRPYTCQAALLFVDLSGYSRITAAIAHRGAHVLSAAVNAYLSRLLKIIHQHGGDVIKFAGDAILVVWEGDEQELEINVLCAARCVLELQHKAGSHAVEGTSHCFHIHCGLCCGPLDSEIFEAPTHETMQRLYHYVGGESMAEIGDLVDLAKAGETCVSRNCFNFLESGGTYRNIPGPLGAKLLETLELVENGDLELVELMDWHIQTTLAGREARRDVEAFEEDFIHGNVLAYLSHGGLNPTQIAQMRNLCVLFIAMTSKGSSVNWLLEVQAILDKKRCPIVQIIHDDKGVHIVAAVNLYEAIPEASLVGLEVCRELVEKRVGAAVGVALGQTFCGVTGSSAACRWDITGPSVVRAARLMQYALAHTVHFAIDQSLYDDPMAATRMLVLDASVLLKGTSEPIAVYTLSDASLFSAFRILENVHGGVHNEKVQEIQNHIGCRPRSAVMVTGIPLAGMTIACQRAAGFSDLVPYLHLCEASAGFLQLARTIATWFQYVDDESIQQLSKSVMADMALGCWSCAHDQCVRLVNVALEKNVRACFVVDRVHNLDKFSLSLIRECLLEPPRDRRKPYDSFSSSIDGDTHSIDSASIEFCDLEEFDTTKGQICFLCTHMSLYSSKPAEDFVQDIIRSHTSFKIPIITLGEASKEELRTLLRDLNGVEVEDRWIDAYAEASGHSAVYFLERVDAVRNLSAELWKEGKAALFETSADLLVHIPPGLVRLNKELKVTQIRPEIGMVFSKIYDEFPPLCQMVIKIVTIATRRGFYKLPYSILWEAMNDLIAQGVEKKVLHVLVDEMVELCVLKIEDRDERTVAIDLDVDDDEEDRVLSIQSPALADIAMDVCTPVQVQSIAAVLIERLEAGKSDAFQVALVAAGLHSLLNQEEDAMKHLWMMCYHDFLQKSRGWSLYRINKWKEIIDDEIRQSGHSPQAILGDDFSANVSPRRLVSPCIAMLRLYSTPIALGPMSQSLAVVCRNTFNEYGLFHGGTSDEVARLRGATGSASGRYMMQLSVVENYLRDMGFGAPCDEVEAEMEMISFIANPAESEQGVETKAVLVLEEIIPRFVEHRLQRLYKLVGKFKEEEHRRGGLPALFNGAHRAVRRAYAALQSDKSRVDAAQDALMLLAIANWKPRPFAEYLPLAHQQTVANIRDATLKRLSDAEVAMFRHQQNVDDLEAFLIVTALLQHGCENGQC